jgi:hypothetical protein
MLGCSSLVKYVPVLLPFISPGKTLNWNTDAQLVGMIRQLETESYKQSLVITQLKIFFNFLKTQNFSQRNREWPNKNSVSHPLKHKLCL